MYNFWCRFYCLGVSNSNRQRIFIFHPSIWTNLACYWYPPAQWWSSHVCNFLCVFVNSYCIIMQTYCDSWILQKWASFYHSGSFRNEQFLGSTFVITLQRSPFHQLKHLNQNLRQIQNKSRIWKNEGLLDFFLCGALLYEAVYYLSEIDALVSRYTSAI